MLATDCPLRFFRQVGGDLVERALTVDLLEEVVQEPGDLKESVPLPDELLLIGESRLRHGSDELDIGRQRRPLGNLLGVEPAAPTLLGNGHLITSEHRPLPIPVRSDRGHEVRDRSGPAEALPRRDYCET